MGNRDFTSAQTNKITKLNQVIKIPSMRESESKSLDISSKDRVIFLGLIKSPSDSVSVTIASINCSIRPENISTRLAVAWPSLFTSAFGEMWSKGTPTISVNLDKMSRQLCSLSSRKMAGFLAPMNVNLYYRLELRKIAYQQEVRQSALQKFRGIHEVLYPLDE